MSRGRASEATVGIGLPEHLLSATAARLHGLGCPVRLEGYGAPRELVLALKDGRVDAAVRGTMPSSEAMSELKTRIRPRRGDARRHLG